jgi:hypothetical protein
MALNAYASTNARPVPNDRRLANRRIPLIYMALILIESAGSEGKVSNLRIRPRRRLKLHPREKASGHELASVRRAGRNMVRIQQNTEISRQMRQWNQMGRYGVLILFAEIL